MRNLQMHGTKNPHRDTNKHKRRIMNVSQIWEAFFVFLPTYSQTNLQWQTTNSNGVATSGSRVWKVDESYTLNNRGCGMTRK